MTLTYTQRQRKYDVLHHKSRIIWLRDPEAKWSDGSPVSPTDRHQLLQSSWRCLNEPMYGNRSVDLSDTLYLKELEAFEQTLHEYTLFSEQQECP